MIFLAGGVQAPPLGSRSGKHDRLGRGKSMRQRGVVRKPAAISRGQTMAEYALILATIAVVATAFVQNAGTIVSTLVNHVVTLF